MTNDIGEPHSYTVTDVAGRPLRGPLWDLLDAFEGEVRSVVPIVLATAIAERGAAHRAAVRT